jgi:hypothetical protein
LIEEILLLLRASGASEKEKVPSRPSVPYEATATSHFMSILKHVVDEMGWVTFDYLHPKLREIEAAVHKLNESTSRTTVLNEFSELIERTKSESKTTPRRKPNKDIDDDIPF